MKENTRLVSLGRHSSPFSGMVNTPVFRGSTILHESLGDWRASQKRGAANGNAGTYGRFGTPTHHALAEAIAALEGGHRAWVYPSGLAAACSALLSLLSAGDHVLLTDSAYAPTHAFLAGMMTRFGVEVSTYDPCAGAAIEELMRPNTRVVYVESPGSNIFDIQDVPAIAAVAHRHGAYVVMDNTWATPLYFKPFRHGVDVSIQAATKYIVGHSDALLGVVTANERTWPLIQRTSHDLGQITSPDDCYLALRGLRTLGVRLRHHWQAGVAVASWLAERPEVATVLHPALPAHPGHPLWRRDFLGANGLFSIMLQPAKDSAVTAFIDSLRRFGIGLSWGGYESLIVPFDARAGHSPSRLPYAGQALRLHIGLEDPEDLIADLDQAFDRMAQCAREQDRHAEVPHAEAQV